MPSDAINDFIPPKEDRNREIYRRYIAGARAVDLASEYGISLQQVYMVIQMGKRRQAITFNQDDGLCYLQRYRVD